MFLPPQFVPASFSLGAALAWGSSDFVGGYAVRRANTFLFTLIVHASGGALMIALALATHAAFPSRSSTEWALAAGLAAGLSLAAFYRALAVGGMGVAAPVAAVLGAAIPATVGILTQGLPGNFRIAGFALAGVGIFLVSRSDEQSPPRGLGLAVLSGLGFAGFFLCLKQAGGGSALWIAALSRGCSFTLTGLAILWQRNFRDIDSAGVGMGVLSGFIDATGTVLFIRATQTGHLDAVVVISSLYPALTVLLARLFLNERFTRWKTLGILAALAAVPLIAT